MSRRTSLDSPLPVQVLEASPKGHYTQLVVQPLGWYNEPLTVIMQGDDSRAAASGCLSGCKMRVCITVTSVLKRVKRNLLWRNLPDRLICRFIARWRYAYRAYRICRDFVGRVSAAPPGFLLTALMNTLEQTIGNTPLVKLQRLAPDNGSEIWVKLEGNNPAGSVKDRAALSMIVEAENVEKLSLVMC